jgi:hypothetical protein
LLTNCEMRDTSGVTLVTPPNCTSKCCCRVGGHADYISAPAAVACWPFWWRRIRKDVQGQWWLATEWEEVVKPPPFVTSLQRLQSATNSTDPDLLRPRAATGAVEPRNFMVQMQGHHTRQVDRSKLFGGYWLHPGDYVW